MYSIIKIIYGIPISAAASKLKDSYEDPDDPPSPEEEAVAKWIEDGGSPWGDATSNGWGFKILYDGGGAPWEVGYCGVVLGEFTECQNSIHVTSEWTAKLQPTEEQKKEAEDAIAKLHPFLKDVAVGTYFIFHTS